MRVLFVGPSGVNLRVAVERIAAHCTAAAGDEGSGQSRLGPEWEGAAGAPPLDGPRAAPIARIATHYVEDHIADMQPYLDRDGLALQQRTWEEACDEALGEVEAEAGGGGGAAHHFLGMHMPHYRKDRLFPVPSMSRFRR